MKVTNTYVGYSAFGFVMLYECENGKWFEMTKGAFGQRDMYLSPITKDQGVVYIANASHLAT